MRCMENHCCQGPCAKAKGLLPQPKVARFRTSCFRKRQRQMVTSGFKALRQPCSRSPDACGGRGTWFCQKRTSTWLTLLTRGREKETKTEREKK